MTKTEHVNYWLNSAFHDLQTADSLFNTEKYDWCLFVGHLVLEKSLKALFVDRNDNNNPPKMHNLVRLAELCNLELTPEQMVFLDRVNDFNIQTRYPDYKFDFYKICTSDFTEKNLNSIKEYYAWLKSLLT